jgi:hypothetical protein
MVRLAISAAASSRKTDDESIGTFVPLSGRTNAVSLGPEIDSQLRERPCCSWGSRRGRFASRPRSSLRTVMTRSQMDDIVRNAGGKPETYG